MSGAGRRVIDTKVGVATLTNDPSMDRLKTVWPVGSTPLGQACIVRVGIARLGHPADCRPTPVHEGSRALFRSGQTARSQPGERPYWSRSAIIGSVRAARRAGRYEATRARVNSKAQTAANVAGSPEATP
jgi:hypothetical protein